MPYIDQFDGLAPVQDADRGIQNIRTMVVFTDGLVVCAVGITGAFLVSSAVLPRFGALGQLLLTAIRPGQAAVHGHRQEAIRNGAARLGPGGTAAAFARTRRKTLTIPFTDVTGIELAQGPQGKQQLVVRTAPPGTGRGLDYSYLADLTPARVREVLGPLAGERLTVTTRA